MGLAEDNAYILQRYLGEARKPTKREYEKSKKHSVPPTFNAGGSMNWWVLGTGVRFAYGDQGEERLIINRLKMERDIIGCWGSEQHSPVYWSFHLIGRLALLKNTQNPELAQLLKDQIADLFVYCTLALSPKKDLVLWAGMRGSGRAVFASPELWWLYTTYFTDVTPHPPHKSYWHKDHDKYGWLFDQWTALALRSIRPLAEQRLRDKHVQKVRSPTHFMEFAPDNKLVYTEDDQHSSTVFTGASGILLGHEVVAPFNGFLKLRGAGAGSEMNVDYNPVNGHLRVEYTGPYNNIRLAKPVVFDNHVPPLSSHWVWDNNGLRRII